MVSQPTDPRAQRVARLLETLVRVKGGSLRQLERQLGASVGTARRIFTGAISLKLSHILDILAILDVPPALFFRIAFEDTASQTLGEAESLLAQAQKITLPKTELEAVPDENFLRLVEVALERFGVIPARPHAPESQSVSPEASTKPSPKDGQNRPRPARSQRGAGAPRRTKRPGRA